MEQKKANRAGTKNKTWCGVPIDLYRRRKAELSKEDFRAWWLKKTGRPLCLREAPKPDANWRWEIIAGRIQDKLNEANKQIKTLEESIEHYRQLLAQERAPWYKKLFSSKG